MERARFDAMLLTDRRTFFKGWAVFDSDDKMPVIIEIDRFTHPYIEKIDQVGAVNVLIPIGRYGE